MNYFHREPKPIAAPKPIIQLVLEKIEERINHLAKDESFLHDIILLTELLSRAILDDDEKFDIKKDLARMAGELGKSTVPICGPAKTWLERTNELIVLGKKDGEK
jgi:hypothetical protein